MKNEIKYNIMRKKIEMKKIKNSLFPSGTLQERKDNLLYCYAIWGSDFLKMLYEKSRGLQQEFCVVEEI